MRPRTCTVVCTSRPWPVGNTSSSAVDSIARSCSENINSHLVKISLHVHARLISNALVYILLHNHFVLNKCI